MSDVTPTNPAVPALDARGLPVGYNFRPDWEVTPRQVQARITSAPESALLLDCRRPDEWDRNRLPGAVHIPMQETDRRADELEDAERGRNHPIIVYCHHGVRSLRVAATLRAMGFSDVKSMAGGIDAWSMGVDPTVPRY
jgi:rhodanese-related sulfurtransferase